MVFILDHFLSPEKPSKNPTRKTRKIPYGIPNLPLSSPRRSTDSTIEADHGGFKSLVRATTDF